MKTNLTRNIITVTILALTSTTLYSENLIQNGSFEDYAINKDHGRWKEVTFNHWTGKGEAWNAKIGKSATQGEHKIELDVGRELNELSQIVSTVEGQKYKLSLDAYGRRKNSSDFHILINGEILRTIRPDKKWAEYSAYFVGNGSEQVISLQELESQNNGRGAIIDNVKLQESSELIINGGFEEFTTNSDHGKWKEVSFKSWEGKGEVWTNRCGKRSTQGAYKIELDVGRELNSLSQMIQTENNTEYSLSLDAYARKVNSSDFEVWVDNHKIETIKPTSKWQNYSFKFFGNGEIQSIQIRELESQNNGRGAIIDNVSLVSIPTISDAPYDLTKFQDVLNKSDLQWQSSINGSYNILKNMEGVFNDYFYLSSNGHMTFEIADSGQKRAELRQKNTWTPELSDVKMSGKIKCDNPDGLYEYTFMQVFNYWSGKPSARLLWHKTRGRKTNNLWAFVKTDAGERKVDLGANPSDLFDVEVSIVNFELVIKINDVVKLTQNIETDSYWNGYFYFKAGAYVSGSINNNVPEGERDTKTEFESLNFYRTDK